MVNTLHTDTAGPRLLDQGARRDPGEGQGGDADELRAGPKDQPQLALRPHRQLRQQQPRRGRLRDGQGEEEADRQER